MKPVILAGLQNMLSAVYTALSRCKGLIDLGIKQQTCLDKERSELADVQSALATLNGQIQSSSAVLTSLHKDSQDKVASYHMHDPLLSVSPSNSSGMRLYMSKGLLAHHRFIVNSSHHIMCANAPQLACIRRT